MRFILLLYQDEAGFWFRLSPPEREAAAAAYADYAAELAAAGALAGGGRFRPYTEAWTVRPGAGAPRVQPGPYADTPEQLGGWFLIDAADAAAARAWAARCPAAGHGAVELRPLAEGAG